MVETKRKRISSHLKNRSPAILADTVKHLCEQKRDLPPPFSHIS